ncbi:hypothetical protein [Bradyrhizobium lablabi]|uniref:hypothetical protein n=1 Tax=Bradyrhizobium lablabi TaxID=722472 RepID=UPI001BAE1AE6|nr:hypothetical protein [Bradyrhizobium lablabi]MBR0695818.1 hypothetical protein [Bradyrhizobium lablabi]
MEYRGIEYTVVRKISPNGWRWTVKCDHKDKVGTAFDRESAIHSAKKFIDALIKVRLKPER